jgi:CubicO group peptidase (beta-lactamase class C family)
LPPIAAAATTTRSEHTLPKGRMARHHTPGVSIAVVNNFELEWARGVGVADARSGAPVKTNTLFQAASISKPITALAVMRLVQDGVLDLDTDVNHYLKSWRVPANAGWQPVITLRQILSHSAGLTVNGFPGYPVGAAIPTVPQLLSGLPPANTPRVIVNQLPGTRFRYSGGGTTIAQQVLTDRLGMPFPEIMRTLVLEPLGMHNSTYAQPLPATWQKQAATAHPWHGAPLKGRFHIYPEMAPAGLWTTATDLAKCGVALLRGVHGKDSTSVFTKATIESMFVPQLPQEKPNQGNYCGLGFFCSGSDAGFRFGHDGWNEGFVSRTYFYKNLGTGIAIMINSNEGHQMFDEIADAVAAEYGWPNDKPVHAALRKPAPAADFVGVYEAHGMAIRVALDSKSKLTVQLGTQPPLPLTQQATDLFSTPALQTSIRFERAKTRNAKQRVSALVLDQDGERLVAKRRTQEGKA